MGKLRLKVLPRDRILSLTMGHSITCVTPYWQSKPPQRIPPPELLVREEERVACFPGSKAADSLRRFGDCAFFRKAVFSASPVPAANQAPGNALPLRA